MRNKELLKQKLDKMKGAINGHFDPVAADIAFHATILEISHNRFYHQLTPIVETALRFSIRLTNKAKGALADYDAHEKIYKPSAAAMPTRPRVLSRIDPRSAGAGHSQRQDQVLAPGFCPERYRKRVSRRVPRHYFH